MSPNDDALEAVAPRGPARWIGLAFSPALLALADQCVVSALRFATTMILGRFCGSAGLGLYVVMFSIILAFALAQEALLSKPYSVFANQMRGTRRRIYSGSVLAQLACLILLASGLALAGSITASVPGWLSDDARQASWGLVVALPGILLWEFARRFALARFNMRGALAIDASLFTLQSGVLLAWAWFGELTVFRALMVIGGVATFVGGGAVLAMSGAFHLSRRHFVEDTRRNWKFGRWMLAGQVIGLVQAYTVPWLMMIRLGAEQTGVLMACQTIVLLSNPLLLGISNWLGPTAANVYSSGGLLATRRLVTRATAALGGLMTVFWLVLVLGGEWLLWLAFGASYTGQGRVIGITGLTALGFGLTVGSTSGLAAIHQPQYVLYGTLTGTAVSLLCFFPLVHLAHLEGAAWSLAAGSLAAAAVHIAGFFARAKVATAATEAGEGPRPGGSTVT